MCALGQDHMNESSPALQKLPKRLKDTAEISVSPRGQGGLGGK